MITVIRKVLRRIRQTIFDPETTITKIVMPIAVVETREDHGMERADQAEQQVRDIEREVRRLYAQLDISITVGPINVTEDPPSPSPPTDHQA